MSALFFDPVALVSDLAKADHESAVLILSQRLREANKVYWGNAEYEGAIELLLAFRRGARKAGYLKQPPRRGISPQAYLDELTRQIEARLGPLVSKRRKNGTGAKYRSEIQSALQIFEAARPKRRKFGFAKLRPDEKVSCHELLKQLRDIVEHSDLDSEKKNAISERINGLSAEIDKDHTRTEGFSALIGDFIIAYTSLAKKAKPAFEITRELLSIVLGRSAADQGIKLPQAGEVSVLEREKTAG